MLRIKKFHLPFSLLASLTRSDTFMFKLGEHGCSVFQLSELLQT